MSRPASVTVRAPAKVNLELRVGAARDDGFHELATVFQALALVDDVTLTSTEGRLSDGVKVTVTGEIDEEQLAAVPLDETNLAVRAVEMFGKYVGGRRRAPTGVALHIHKRIPVAGGMAGGSADALAALIAIDALWDFDTPREHLMTMAARLGSDVPFAMVGGTAIGTGRGELLTSAMVRGKYTWVLALSRQGLSTPSVFAEIDRLREGRILPVPRVTDELMAALRSGNAVALGARLVNDLQPAALSLRPQLHETLQVGLDCDVLGSIVSGSGPTVAFLVADDEAARELSAQLLMSQAADQVVTTWGPVPGARVVDVTWPT